VSIGALSLNTLLGYMLILGNFGFPRLGVRGAGIATATAFILEFFVIVALTYALKTPIAAKVNELFDFNWAFFKRFLRTSAPVILTEILWSIGVSVYTAIYARISTESLAAVNISSSLEQLGFVGFIGLGNACAIMVGNRIGAGEPEKAYRYAGRFILIGFLGSLLFGVLIFFISTPVLSLYQISETARSYAQNILYIFSLTIWMRVLTIVLIMGVIRSGGDTRFAFLADILTLWLIGIPIALTGAFVFHLPVYYVYLLVLIEELVKLILVFRRYLSRKWINDLTTISAKVESSPISTI
jgi:Na+-driven multidrug efflux pump